MEMVSCPNSASQLTTGFWSDGKRLYDGAVLGAEGLSAYLPWWN